ncbi:MAG TPA: substrate-binding domain-containing protein [Candidatus Excrementavichristensenella intestinipullorum]|nr:substrate-binding domain-containing protein [Candidatus Excrementavichristensenella intestinipullorum]
MKKLVALLLAALLMLSGSAALANVADEVALGEAMTHEELLEKALAEEGSFVVYGNTSRIATALEEFTALYGIAGEANNLKDAEIYIKLETEMSGGAKGADMVMIQDGASLKSQALEMGYLVNFVPASVKDSVGEEDLNPLVQQYINKVFIWNNLGDNAPAITNVWQLTEPQMKGNVIFKNPESEQVNMNFLVMLTSPEWSDKLAQAYESLYGTPIDLSGYENAGYKWIAEFLSNCTFGNSDTTIAEDISQESAQGKIGLFVLSKLRSSSVYTDNLTVGQYKATEEGTAIEPFSGFMYPMYAMVTSNASRPYTAMLFIEYLMTSEGFAPWGKSIGAYSTNTQVVPNEGDLGIDVWKQTLVMEDPDYILDAYEDVYSFVLKYLQ